MKSSHLAGRHSSARARSVAALLLATIALLSGAARAEGPGEIVVSFLEGNAEASAGDPALFKPLALGDRLVEGEQLRTQAGARLELRFGSGTIVRVGENSSLVLSEAPPMGGRFRAKLVFGNFWAHVRKLLVGETFAVETENAVAGVRGTIFRVESGSDVEFVRVYEGRVHVESRHAVQAGELESNHELRIGKDGLRGPSSPFTPESEEKSPFMQWVRERQKADERERGKSKEREHKTHERERARTGHQE
jgi:ferric-dicitrate binding protein FerR (iron transport regulator)